MNKIIFIISLIFIIGFFSYFVLGSELNYFTNLLTVENLSFSQSENITRNLNIPKNVNVSFAKLNLSGFEKGLPTTHRSTYVSTSVQTATEEDLAFNGTYIFMTDYSDRWVYIYYPNMTWTGMQVGIFNGTTPKAIAVNTTNVLIWEDKSSRIFVYNFKWNYLGNITLDTAVLKGNVSGMDANDSSIFTTSTYNGTTYEWNYDGTYTGRSFYVASNVGRGVTLWKDYFWITLEAQGGIGFLGGVYLLSLNGTILGYNFSLDQPHGITHNGTDLFIMETNNNQLYDYPINSSKLLNPYIQINNSRVWNFTGDFAGERQNQTSNFAEILNEYLAGCNATSNNCTMPFEFFSLSQGYEEYSSINITYWNDPTLTYLGKSNFTGSLTKPGNIIFNLTLDHDVPGYSTYTFTENSGMNGSTFNPSTVNVFSSNFTEANFTANETMANITYSGNITVTRSQDGAVFKFPVIISVVSATADISFDNNTDWTESIYSDMTVKRIVNITNKGNWNCSNLTFSSSGLLNTYLSSEGENNIVSGEGAAYNISITNPVTYPYPTEYLTATCGNGDSSGNPIITTNDIDMKFTVTTRPSSITPGGGSSITIGLKALGESCEENVDCASGICSTKDKNETRKNTCVTSLCGDGNCGEGETLSNCPSDCRGITRELFTGRGFANFWVPWIIAPGAIIVLFFSGTIKKGFKLKRK